MDYSIETGKCCDCHEPKTLDSMIRKDGKKGLYHCIDCESLRYDFFGDATVSDSKFKKLMGWCFG